jgi:DNA-binding NtrC family response regulator
MSVLGGTRRVCQNVMNEQKYLHGILVVDDEPLVLKYTTSVIAGFGYKKVLRAGDAQTARAVMAAEGISLIISDVSLPDGDGRELVREALERNPAAVGVLISGFACGDLSIPADLIDRVKLLEKPFVADDISHVFGELIDRRSEIPVSNPA